VEKRVIASGKWLRLVSLERTCPDGKIREWETVERVGGRGAAVVIAKTRPSNRLILVRQFRPPANGFTIEFPAGLIDQGESAEETAVRELREETGYSGTVERVWPAAFSSPGLSGETVTFVEISVDENSAENNDLETDFDDGEDVETIVVPVAELAEFLFERETAGDKLDAKLLAATAFAQRQP